MGIVNKLKKLGVYMTVQYEGAPVMFNYDILYKDLKHDDDAIVQRLFESVKERLSQYISKPSEEANADIELAGKSFDSFCLAKKIDVIVFLIVIHNDDDEDRDIFYLDNITGEVRQAA